MESCRHQNDPENRPQRGECWCTALFQGELSHSQSLIDGLDRLHHVYSTSMSGSPLRCSHHNRIRTKRKGESGQMARSRGKDAHTCSLVICIYTKGHTRHVTAP